MRMGSAVLSLLLVADFFSMPLHRNYPLANVPSPPPPPLLRPSKPTCLHYLNLLVHFSILQSCTRDCYIQKLPRLHRLPFSADSDRRAPQEEHSSRWHAARSGMARFHQAITLALAAECEPEISAFVSLDSCVLHSCLGSGWRLCPIQFKTKRI